MIAPPRHVCPFSGLPASDPLYLFKSLLPKQRTWACSACGRMAPATIDGTRGHYFYRFNRHPARGVTKRQWAEQEATT